MSWSSSASFLSSTLGRRFVHRSVVGTRRGGTRSSKIHHSVITSRTTIRSSSLATTASDFPVILQQQQQQKQRFVSDDVSITSSSSSSNIGKSSKRDNDTIINEQTYSSSTHHRNGESAGHESGEGLLESQPMHHHQQQVEEQQQPSSSSSSNSSSSSSSLRVDVVLGRRYDTGTGTGTTATTTTNDVIDWKKLMGEPLQKPAGALSGDDVYDDTISEKADMDSMQQQNTYIPEVSLYLGEGGRTKKRILVLCTGGTMTMAPNPQMGGALSPVEGAISKYMDDMDELKSPDMPDYVLHEYTPFRDSSDLGPSDWVTLANDIKANYLHFDGFVVLHGTDTMAYAATALSFMLENLGKPVIFSGSQIPLCEPYNDARRNLIMAMIFASRDTINEVSIFFHDRLLRANRATKVNTHKLRAFDSPNIDPLATIGITIDENDHLILPPPKGALRVHTRLDTRLLTIRLVPGFDDEMIGQMIEANVERPRLRALVLQLYGTGNIPSVKESFIDLLATASSKGILVIAATQCYTGHVMMGHYATGRALEQAGVVSAGDMTVEAIACKCAYLFGRQDLSTKAVGELMGVPLRGEITPPELLSPPPLSTDYQRAMQKKRRYF